MKQKNLSANFAVARQVRKFQQGLAVEAETQVKFMILND